MQDICCAQQLADSQAAEARKLSLLNHAILALKGVAAFRVTSLPYSHASGWLALNVRLYDAHFSITRSEDGGWLVRTQAPGREVGPGLGYSITAEQVLALLEAQRIPV